MEIVDRINLHLTEIAQATEKAKEALEDGRHVLKEATEIYKASTRLYYIMRDHSQASKS